MMPRRLHAHGLIALLLAVGAAGSARAAGDDAAERERIRAERAEVEASYLQQVQACRAKFVVTSCADQARAQRHEALARLDQQQAALDEARRKQRAAERQQAIDSKVGGEEARLRDEAAAKRSASPRSGSEPRPAPSTPASAAPRSPSHAGSQSAAARAEQEARAREAYERKQLKAEAHRQEVERRNEQRAKKAKPAAPLPSPAASGISKLPPAGAVPASAASR